MEGDGTGREEYGKGREGRGRDGTGRDGKGWEGQGRAGQGRAGQGRTDNAARKKCQDKLLHLPQVSPSSQAMIEKDRTGHSQI